jgi:hypothetical protein
MHFSGHGILNNDKLGE